MNKQIIYILSIVALLTPSAIFALDFDPNFLISDQEMQNATTMNREDIQAFLDEKAGYISSIKISDKDNVTRDAADIIDRAAKEHTINPKYLLVKLQKEQSLVTSDNPTQKQLDWATGYGICDACSMSDPKLQKNKGFGVQVDSAAAVIRWYYDNYSSTTWIKRANVAYNIDNTNVTPTTNATGFLYTYTPHIQGNENFWKLWQSWFDQLYPDGSLLKSSQDDQIYLIQNKTKRLFKTYGILLSRHNPELIISVPESELSRYELGSEINLPNFSVIKEINTNNYYLLDYETKRKFSSYQIVKDLGYYPDEILDVSNSDLNNYSFGTPITSAEKSPSGRLVQIIGSDTMYYLKDDSYAPIFDNAIAEANFLNITPELIEITKIIGYKKTDPILLKNGTLFGITGGNKIYVVENNKKRHIASEEVFNGLGYKWENIVWVNMFAGELHETGEPLYVKKSADKTIETAKEKTKEENVESKTTAEPSSSSSIDDLMQVTSLEDTTYIGNKIETNIDAYLIADYETQQIISGKNIDVVRSMASLTKVQTAYSALQHGLRTERSTTYQEALHKSQFHKYLIGEGDKVLNSDLLDAMLVSSLNTPAHMLAYSTSGNEKDFILELNKDLKELNLTKTKVLEPSGAEVGNVTTAKEYLTLFSVATRNKTMLEIMGKKSYSYTKVLNVSGIRSDHWSNHSNALAKSDQDMYRVIASKTGYLYESGANLAMLVERLSDNKKFVVITLGNVDFANRFAEPNNIANWAMRSL